MKKQRNNVTIAMYVDDVKSHKSIIFIMVVYREINQDSMMRINGLILQSL